MLPISIIIPCHLVKTFNGRPVIKILPFKGSKKATNIWGMGQSFKIALFEGYKKIVTECQNVLKTTR